MKGLIALVAALTLAVGVIAGTLINKNVSAQSATPAVTLPSPPADTEGNEQGTFKSNEDSAHEAKESKEWEAQEDAGIRTRHEQNGQTGNPVVNLDRVDYTPP
jgi:hypothetical protein